MSQHQLFVPAAPGWYVRPGDPPEITRHWDGRQWLCEIRGPIRDEFDYLRALSFQGLSPEDQRVLGRLTGEVSRIEDLVLAFPTADPPLVQVDAPSVYTPPPVDPYTSIPLAAHQPGAAQRSAAAASRKVLVAIVAVVLVAVAAAAAFVLSQMGPLR
ncbi:MAG: hypothetical protein ACYC1E_04280 [Propionibacteriaceae bacterium]